MGLAYFYSYEGGEKSGKSMSQTWFEKAAESESLDKDKKELSKRFASIAAYYASLVQWMRADTAQLLTETTGSILSA